MPHDKVRDICERIQTETDREKLTILIAQLTKLLQEEQDEIQAKIRRNVDGRE